MDQDPKPGPQSGGINIGGGSVSAGGDIAGRDVIKIAPPPEKVLSLHQLPAPPADFTGRAAELAELHEAVKTGGVNISAGIQGLGGVGKTALALKLADRLKPEYPDAQFYLDLKGVSSAPLSPRDAMAHIVRAWHPAAQLPETEDEMAALYRSVLEGKRALLLMDNARDAAQVRPLIPPTGCLLLVTSRQHFILPGLVEKDLNKLPPGDACALLVKIAPRLSKEKKEVIDELARLSGHLPLALEKVASALRVKKNLIPADYARRLDAQQRLQLTETDAALQSSYDLLTPDLQQGFRLLAVFPDSFALQAASDVWQRDDDSAQDRLGQLLAYSLVEYDEIAQRYRLHDLVRVFAGQSVSSEERMAAQKSHAGHYFEVLRAAEQLYGKGGESVVSGLALFDREWSNIQAGQAWAVLHSESDNEAAKLCCLYPGHGIDCLSLRLLPRERIPWLQSALSTSRKLKRRDWEGVLLGNLGNTYHLLGEYILAIEYQTQYLQIVGEIGDRRGESTALVNVGNDYFGLSDYRRAIEYYERGLAIASALQDRRSESYALGNLANANFALGDARRAIEQYKQVLEIAHDIGDRRSEANSLGNLGTIYCYLGEPHCAIYYQEKSLQIKRDIGDRQGEGNALFGSALALSLIGDRGQAISRAEAALKIFEDIESPAAANVRGTLAEWREKK